MTEKVSAYIPVSDEMLDDARRMQEAERRWREATPQQREQWRREAAQRRFQERINTPGVPLTVEALAERMGWDRQYAEHLVQPYCTCGEYSWGWDYCEHARDLGFGG